MNEDEIMERIWRLSQITKQVSIKTGIKPISFDLNLSDSSEQQCYKNEVYNY